MKQLFYLSFFLSISLSLQAQTEVPLQANRNLQRYYAEQEARLPRGWREAQSEAYRGPGGFCNLEQAGKIYINAGATYYIDANIDTTGLGPEPGQLNCLNCDGNPIGQTTIIGDSLAISADAGILGAEYRFTVEFCNPNGCRNKSFTAVGRRRGAHYFPPAILLPPQGRTMAEGQPALLPGPLACNRFIDAADRYEGRDQRFYFTTYTAVDSTFHYDASRYAGVDSVFLVLCDTFAICDTFHFAFRIQRDTLKLATGGREVFMDDFSGKGPLPDIALWLDADPYVNQEFAVDPPSVGVATFDGLGPKGQPYGGGLGPADRLTSTYLDLTALAGDLFVSFWLQPGGLGERPRPQDKLTLEYRDFNGDWDEFISITIDSFPAAPGQVSPFRFFSFPVPPLYKHGAFQFRLTNYNNRNGINNIWQVDYIRLGKDARDSIVNDVAFTALPLPILENYSSMPWRHFEGKEADLLRKFITLGLRNHFAATVNASDPSSSYSIVEQSTGITIEPGVTLLNGEERNLPPGLPLSRVYPLDNAGSIFPPAPFGNILNAMRSDDFDGPGRLDFTTEYTLSNGGQLAGNGYEPILRNDAVSSSTVFDNYFAYDDGTAESALIAQEDDQIAVKFTATVDDTLRAVRFHFPHMISNVSNQEFNLKVWIGALDGEPEFVMNFLRPFYPDQALDTLQGYTTYPLVDAAGNLQPLGLPAGDFYIGWEQLTSCNFTDCIPVGLDKNTPSGQAVSYFKRGNSNDWRSFPELGVPIPAGALMLRPIVGSETPGPTSTHEPESEALGLRVFPNPAQDIFNLYLPAGNYHECRIELYNMAGQLLLRDAMPPQLDLSSYQSGIFLLRVQNVRTREWVQQKVIKR